MPTYVYRCPACGHEFEKFHKISVTGRPKCPKCGKAADRTITGGGGLLFKGSGFYSTDYKKAPKEQEGQEGSKGEKSDKSDKSGKPEPKAPKKTGDEH